ncbi:hypothetical protein [Vannielia sp.]|nr:hypothetical protein [Vannielia sp.]
MSLALQAIEISMKKPNVWGSFKGLPSAFGEAARAALAMGPAAQ